MRGSYTGPGKGSDPAKAARVAEQKKVMQALQGGGGITAYSANPLVAGIERLGNIFAGTQQPTVYASKLGGREVLQAAGGWNPASQPANINVAGRTWDLAKSGNEAVYLPRSGGTLAAVTPSLNTGGGGGGGGGDTRVVVEERNYQAEKARAAQLAEQDQLSKKYRVADLTKAYNAAQGEEKEKLGLEIWATTNPQLAAKLKPGQLGYTEASSAFMSASPLGSYVKSVGDMQFANKTAFPTEPLSTEGFSLETPISGINLPTGLDQVGVSERFANVSPATMNAAMSAFSDPLKFFKPDLTQTQQSLLRQAFEKGLK
jgi:hypothetical protein